MKLQLPASVTSPQDLRALALEIRGYARWSSHNTIKKRANPKSNSEQPAMTTEAKELLSTWMAHKPLTAQSLDDLGAALQTLGQTAQTITITLAAPATKSLKLTLVSWCRENIAPDVLVTFQFNATLLGGMVVRSGSHVFDWSFRRQILESRSKFPEVLRRV